MNTAAAALIVLGSLFVLVTAVRIALWEPVACLMFRIRESRRSHSVAQMHSTDEERAAWLSYIVTDEDEQ